MNKLMKIFYSFAFSYKNPVFRHFMKHEIPDWLYGETYTIVYDNKELPVLLYPGTEGVIFDIHGGGYAYGDYRDEDHFCRYLNEKTGMTVISCNYSLSGEAKFPTQIEQVYETIKCIVHDPRIDSSNIYLIGHSAGANCAAAQTLLSNRRKDFRIDKLVLNYPVLDLNCDPKTRPKVQGNNISHGMMSTFNLMYFRSDADSRSPLASPLLAGEEELSIFPPTYILTCSRDTLRIDGIKFYKRLLKAGVNVHYHEAEASHGFVEDGTRGFYQQINQSTEQAITETDNMVDWWRKEEKVERK